MVKAGLGVAALLILILSTVTTTFLDAYSAGISAESLSKKINGKYAALIVTVIGTVCAICFPMDDITNFLYLIGSVFAPMIAIQITDFFLLRRGGARGKLDVCNAVVWVLGFALYRVLMTVDIPVGNTLPDMAATMLLCVTAHKLVPDKIKACLSLLRNLPSRKRPHTVRAFLRLEFLSKPCYFKGRDGIREADI